MSASDVDHLLIGGGVAAASCAAALRENGAEGSIALLTRELEPPYHRPPCTKDLLRGESAREDAYVHDAAWYADHDIDLRTRTAVRAIDIDAHAVKLQGGDELGYGNALLATGSLVNRLRVDGSDLDGLHYVRALGNAESIRDDAEHAERVVVVGGSYIGCEAAASLTELGKKVTILMQEDEPMQRGFGPAVGRWVRGLLEGHGIEILAGGQLERFEGDGRVQLVVTGDGTELPADLVVLGTGVKPDVMLAQGAGLQLGESGGVKCDSRLQTSAPDLYAAGDICEYDSVVHGRRLRVEHEAVAEAQGAHAAAAMLGAQDKHTEVPYFWTDLADWGSIEYVGPAAEWDEEIVRGSMDDGEFSVLYLAGDKAGGLRLVRSRGRPHGGHQADRRGRRPTGGQPRAGRRRHAAAGLIAGQATPASGRRACASRRRCCSTACATWAGPIRSVCQAAVARAADASVASSSSSRTPVSCRQRTPRPTCQRSSACTFATPWRVAGNVAASSSSSSAAVWPTLKTTPSSTRWYSVTACERSQRPSARSRAFAGRACSNRSTTPAPASSRTPPSGARPSTSVATRSKNRAWRRSSSAWAAKQALSSGSSVPASNGSSWSATARSATQKPASSRASGTRTYFGSFSHASASPARSSSDSSQRRRSAARKRCPYPASIRPE